MIALPFGLAGRVLPLGRDGSLRFLPWLFAPLVYLAALCGIGLLTVGDTLRAFDQSLETSLTVQVPAETSEARLQTILGLLRQTKGITGVHQLARNEMAQLLAPWLGPSAPLDELPVPRLIDLQVDPGATFDLTALRQQLVSVAPETRLDDHRPWLADLRGTARHIEAVLSLVTAASLLLVTVSAIYAVRTMLVVQASVVQLVHLLGAADVDIAGQFTFRALLFVLSGGVAGAAAALLTFLALRGVGRIAQLPAASLATGLADWRLWAVLAGTVLLAGLLAMASAQVTVRRRLARLP